MGDAGRDHDPLVGGELVRLDRRRGRRSRPRPAGRRRARRAPDPRRRSSSRAGGGGSAGRGARRRRTSRGWPGRTAASVPAGAPVSSGVSAGNADSRHSSRNEPRLSAWRATRPSRTPAQRRTVALAHRGRAGPRRSAGDVVGQGGLPRPERLAARAAASARGRPRPAASRRAARSTPGTSSIATSSPAWRNSSRAQSARDATPPFTTWWTPRDVARRRAAPTIASARSWRERRRAELVADDPQRLPRRAGPVGRREDLGREVVARAARTARPSGRCRGRPRRPLRGTAAPPPTSPASFDAPYALIGFVGSSGAYPLAVGPASVEDLVRADLDEVDAARGASPRRGRRPPRRSGAAPAPGRGRSRRRRSRPRR